MFYRVLGRNPLAVAAVMALSVLIITTAAFHMAKEPMEARGGTEIELADGVRLSIYPDALEEDDRISAHIDMTKNLVRYKFGPSGTTFARTVELSIDCEVMDDWDLGSLTLYGEDEEAIQPAFRGRYVIYNIPHFSLYYHRRR